MRLLTLGRIDVIKREIASVWVEPGHEVLEIGCGAGTLAALMTGRGARVTGIDVSNPMLALAQQTAPDAELFHMTATEIEKLGEGRFDRIVSTLAFSELSEDEINYVLRAAAVLLKPGGMLVVADEVRPGDIGQRIASAFVRWPLAAITFLLTQNTTHALKDFDGKLRQAGFRVAAQQRYLLGTLILFVAEKP